MGIYFIIFIGESMAFTKKDVAREAGVSERTVTRVINNMPHVKEKIRKKVRSIIEKYDYNVNMVAKSLSKGKGFDLVGLITNIDNLFGRFYFTQIIQGVEMYLEKNGYSLVIINLLDQINEGLEKKINIFSGFYYSHLVKGYIVLAPAADDPRVERLGKNHVNGIVIGSKSKDAHFGNIDIDNKKGVYKLIDEMVRKGHRKIAIIKGPKHLTSAIEREAGFRDRMKYHKIAVKSSYVVCGDYTRNGGQIAANILFSLKEPPTAVFAANDDMACGVYDEAQKRGLIIPDDIAVGGFDDIDLASQLNPPLTTLAQPLKLMGERAAECLIQKRWDSKILLPAVLMKRKSI